MRAVVHLFNFSRTQNERPALGRLMEPNERANEKKNRERRAKRSKNNGFHNIFPRDFRFKSTGTWKKNNESLHIAICSIDAPPKKQRKTAIKKCGKWRIIGLAVQHSRLSRTQQPPDREKIRGKKNN